MGNRLNFDDCETIEAVIGQVVGAASMSWEFIEQAGNFDTTWAIDVFNAAIARLGELGVTQQEQLVDQNAEASEQTRTNDGS